MTSFFLNCNFEHFQTSHCKNGIFGILTSNWFKSTYFLFKKKNKCKNLTFYDPGLTRLFFVVDLHGVRLQNGTDF